MSITDEYTPNIYTLIGFLYSRPFLFFMVNAGDSNSDDKDDNTDDTKLPEL